MTHRTNNTTRTAVMERDKRRCRYCGEEANTVDHVLPRSRGGSSSRANLVAACEPCNFRKGNRTPEEAKMVVLCRECFNPPITDKPSGYSGCPSCGWCL